MRAVDTNLLVCLLVRDDARQLAAAEAFVAGGAWVSHIVLVEAMWVLESLYERSSKQIASAVGMLLAHSSLAIQDPDVVSSALERLVAKPVLGFSDCLVLEVARKAGHLPLGTFDRTLGRQPGTMAL